MRGADMPNGANKKAPSEVGGAGRRTCHVKSARSILHRPGKMGFVLAAVADFNVAHGCIDSITTNAGK
jgi:hypothetical protein